MNTSEKIKSVAKKVKKEKENKKTIFSFKAFLIVLLPIIILAGLIHGINFVFTKIAPAKTYFLDQDISFKTKSQIEEIIQNEKNKILKTQVVFTIEDDQSNKIIKNFFLNKIINEDLDERSIDDIFSNFSNIKIDIPLFFSNLFKTKNYKFNYSINTEELKEIKNEIRKGEKPTLNAAIIKDEKKNNFVIKKEEIGFSYDLDIIDTAIDEYIESFERQNILNILITKTENQPKITFDLLKTTLEQANGLLSVAPINVYYLDKKTILKKDELINMLSFEYSLDDNNDFKEVSIKLDQENIYTFLNKQVEENDTKPENGELVLDDEGKATKFVPIKKGYSLNKEDSFNKMQNGILTSQKDIYLTVEESIPTEEDSNVVKYGLLEKIATGESNFKGSSYNRILNIKVGSSYVNGTLVKPGEEFSLLKTLKSADASMGYVPELVIKGNKTEMEYGGGLCQVATTVFRTAIDGGFPITERKNHSYRVSYYEPAGTDATIYFPGPDFKFLNDTNNYIIITTNVNTKTNTLTYEIWGTSDNRKVTIGEPIITNIVLAPGTKWVETTELPVDEIKCTESAHNGADAQFTYVVEYENGEKKETVFKSKYVPWQAICLKGVEQLTEDGENMEISQEE